LALAGRVVTVVGGAAQDPSRKPSHPWPAMLGIT
jgi:hypothetical protein